MSFLLAKTPSSPESVSTFSPYEVSGKIAALYGNGLITPKLAETPFNRNKNKEGSGRDPKPNAYYYSIAYKLLCHEFDSFNGFSSNNIFRDFKIDMRNPTSVGQAPVDSGNNKFVYSDDRLCVRPVGTWADPNYRVWVGIGYGDFGINMALYPGARDRTETPNLLDGNRDSEMFGGHRIPDGEGDFVFRAAPNLHPPYPQDSLAIMHTLSCGAFEDLEGSNGSRLPDIKFILGRTLRDLEFPYPATDDWMKYGENPIAIAYDILTNKVYGMGKDDVNEDQFKLKASEFLLEGFYKFDSTTIHKLFISVPLIEGSDAVALLSKVLKYIDGYLYPGSDGRIEIGYVKNKVETVEGIPIIRKEHFMNPIEISRLDWGAVPNTVSASYTSADRVLESYEDEDEVVESRFETTTIKERDPSAFLACGGETRKETLTFKEILYEDPCRTLAKLHLSKLSNPSPKVDEAQILPQFARYSDGTPFKVGSKVQMDYNSLFSDTSVLLVTQVDNQEDGTKIAFERLRSSSAPSFSADRNPIIAPDDQDPTDFDAGEYRAWEIPVGLFPLLAENRAVAILAQRPDDTDYASVSFSPSGLFTGEQSELDDLTDFIDIGNYSNLWNDGTSDILDFTQGTGIFDTDYLTMSYSSSDTEVGTMLILIGETLFSLGEKLESPSASVKRYRVEVSFMDTAEPGSFTVADQAFIFPKEKLAPITGRPEYEITPTSSIQDATTYYKLAPVSNDELSGDFSAAFSVTLDIPSTTQTTIENGSGLWEGFVGNEFLMTDQNSGGTVISITGSLTQVNQSSTDTRALQEYGQDDDNRRQSEFRGFTEAVNYISATVSSGTKLLTVYCFKDEVVSATLKVVRQSDSSEVYSQYIAPSDFIRGTWFTIAIDSSVDIFLENEVGDACISGVFLD